MSGHDKDLVWNRHFLCGNNQQDIHCNDVVGLPHHLLAVRDAQEEVPQRDTLLDQLWRGTSESEDCGGRCDDREREVTNDRGLQ